MMQNNYERSASTYQPVVQISTLARPAHMRTTPSLELHGSLCSDFRWKVWFQATEILKSQIPFFPTSRCRR